MKTMRILGALALFYCMTAALASADEGEITLMRDAWGTPHVFAQTDEGAFYGLGFACAQDRLFQMTLNLRIVQGRLAETLGDVPLHDGRETALQLDRKMRMMGFYRHAQLVVKHLDDETRALLQAYADGVNDYAEQHRDSLSHLFVQYDVELEPWTPADCVAAWYYLARFFAPEGLHDTMAYHNRAVQRDQELVIDDSASVIQREDVEDEWVARVQAFMQNHSLASTESGGSDGEEGPRFSHAWVVGGEVSGTGAAVLHSDPQTPVRNPSVMYEFHIQGETINARGIGTPGSPILLIGWNENVAWGMTALAADQADQFFLKTDEERPNQYLFDDEWRDMDVREEVILVKDGEAETVSVRETHLGPIVTELAHGTRPGEEVALKRIPMAEPTRDTHPSAIAMMRAEGVDAWLDAVEGWIFPSANAVCGDSQGNIGYTLVGAFPVRSAHAIDGGRFTHYGWESKYDWQTMLPHELVPRIVNPTRGFIFSANHRPIASFYPSALTLGTGSGGESLRSWRLRQLMEGRETITPEDALAIHFDDVNPARKAIVEIGLRLREAGVDLSGRANATLDALEEWFEQGARMDRRIPATALAEGISTMFRVVQTDLVTNYGGGQSGLSFFLKSVLQKLDQDVKLSEAEIEYIDETLASASGSSPARGRGAEPVRPQREAETRRPQPEAQPQEALGYFASLDGLGSLDSGHDVAVPDLYCTDTNTILSQRGQAYSMWVPLHDVDSARSLLPPGNTENPASPYYLASLERWADGKLRPAPITREALEALAEETTILKPSRDK